MDDKATEFLQLARAIPSPAPGSTEVGAAEAGLTAGKLDLLETAIETQNLLLSSPAPPVAKNRRNRQPPTSPQ